MFEKFSIKYMKIIKIIIIIWLSIGLLLWGAHAKRDVLPKELNNYLFKSFDKNQ